MPARAGKAARHLEQVYDAVDAIAQGDRMVFNREIRRYASPKSTTTSDQPTRPGHHATSTTMMAVMRPEIDYRKLALALTMLAERELAAKDKKEAA